MADILIVEGDPGLREVLEMQVEDMQHRPTAVGSLGEARQQLEQSCPDLLLIDQQLRDGSGLELLRETHDRRCMPPVIMMTGVRHTNLTIVTIKEGIYDFTRKPMDIDELTTAIGNVLGSRHASRHRVPGSRTHHSSVLQNRMEPMQASKLDLCAGHSL